MSEKANEGVKDPLMVLFGQKLLLARKQAALSQEALADAAALHRTEISLLERGLRGPNLRTLKLLAGALDCPAGELIDDLPIPEPKPRPPRRRRL
jgi:transcriptional regulator with XRE-family HTH domain